MDRLIPGICTGFHYLSIHSAENVKKCVGVFSCQSVVLWFSNWFGALFAVWTTPFGFLVFFESMPSEQHSQMFQNFPNYVENNHCARTTRNLSYHTCFFFLWLRSCWKTVFRQTFLFVFPGTGCQFVRLPAVLFIHVCLWKSCDTAGPFCLCSVLNN